MLCRLRLPARQVQPCQEPLLCRRTGVEAGLRRPARPAQTVPRTERADPPLLRNRVAAEGHPALRHRPVHEPGTFPERARVHAVPQGPGVPQERKEGPPFRGPLRAAIAASESNCANRILRRRPRRNPQTKSPQTETASRKAENRTIKFAEAPKFRTFAPASRRDDDASVGSVAQLDRATAF